MQNLVEKLGKIMEMERKTWPRNHFSENEI